MSFRRTKGLGIIIYTLIPVIWIIIFSTILIDINSLVSGPLKQLNNTLVEVKGKVEIVTGAIGSNLESIDDIRETLAQAIQTAKALPEEIEVPAIPIPTANLPIKPGVRISSNTSNYPVANAVWTNDFNQRAIFASVNSLQFKAKAADVSDNLVGFGLPSLPDIPISPPSLPGNIPNLNPVPTPQITMENVSVSLPTIPGFKLPVPGLSQTKELLHQNVEIIQALNRVLAILPSSDTLQQYFQGEYFQTMQGIGSKLRNLIILLGIFALLSIPWFAITYVAWATSQLTQGWKMLIGQKVT